LKFIQIITNIKKYWRTNK